MAKIAVLDYGSSNLRSVSKALETVAGNKDEIIIADNPKIIMSADKIVFPGQGAIGQCMQNLRDKKLDEVIISCIKNKPFLGICLGLQSLMQHSDEDGGIKGLGLLEGNVIRFSENKKDENNNMYKIPSMGWNRVYQQKEHPLWQGIDDGCRFYFVHSYYVQMKNDIDIASSTEYTCRYTSAASRDNIFATQFHPEKSQQDGLTLLKNFLNWNGND
tara:strand:- start:61 stop:708 length:648 start_codon:yes stop_codon:yes gene_type:complete